MPACRMLIAATILRYQREIVRHQDDGEARSRQSATRRSRISRSVVTSSAVVGSSAMRRRGLGCERAGHGNALRLAATQLMRVFRSRSGRGRDRRRQEVAHAIRVAGRPVPLAGQGARNLPVDCEEGVKCALGVLEQQRYAMRQIAAQAGLVARREARGRSMVDRSLDDLDAARREADACHHR